MALFIALQRLSVNLVWRWKWTVVSGAVLIAVVTIFRLFPTNEGPLPVVSLKAGAGWFLAEVAANEGSMQRGLMNRKSMDEHAGMLFSFRAADKHCMWMRNTLIPLSVAWLDDDGVIVDIQEMAPKSDQLHCSSKPASYALEVNQGAFERQGVAIGMRFL